MKLLPQALAAVLLLTVGPAGAGRASPPPDAKTYEENVRPFLARYCFACHAAAKAKGDLRLDRLSSNISDEADREHWLSVRQRLQAREMPPKERPRPRENEVHALVEWINEKIEASEAGRRKIALRRLNRVEYENTMRELLGVDLELKERLPLDTPAFGFDNNAEAMHVSSFLMEKYLEAADLALNAAIANGPKPTTIAKRYSLKDQHQVKRASERVFRLLGDTVVLFSSSHWQAVTLYQFYPPDRGRYRFRLSVSGFQSQGKPVTFRVDAGPLLMGTKDHLVGYFDAPADKPTVVEFVDYLEARSTIRILPYGLAPSKAVDKVGADKYAGPGLAVQWVEVEGPLNDTWPPASHRRIFGDLPQLAAPRYNSRNRVEVVAKDAEADARRILRAFARRAFRRTVTDDDIKPFVKLFQAKTAQKYSFEQAVRVGLLGVMVSPEFLFLREKPGQLDDFARASRLSYFLWSTMPDEELLSLAERRKLTAPETLRRQVERLLNDPKAAAFIENFVGQWLGLRDIDFTEPSHILYPEFDPMLKVSMVREAELFFRQILKEDLSLTNFVTCDFAMLNGRLAKHYGIPGIEGWEFRKVKLPSGSHRGGVLTMAGVLKVTANGTTTSPVVRGAWVLDRILGTPPPKPPADIPAIEPDIRGATTIRQQLAKHRQVPSCASCHAKIDPPGFALESFDVIGGWREHYRTSGRGTQVIVDGQRMPYLKGPKVDPADVMADGQRFANIDELKQLLLKDRDQLARALTEKLLTYATGAAPTSTGRAEIEGIVRKVRTKNHGLRTLIHEIVQSKAFQQK